MKKAFLRTLLLTVFLSGMSLVGHSQVLISLLLGNKLNSDGLDSVLKAASAGLLSAEWRPATGSGPSTWDFF